jgi:Zn-dependent protease
MPTSQRGCFRLFRFAGIDVYLHWSWLLVGYFEVKSRAGLFRSPAWNMAEYLALFGIVLLHEFGHALACRQVGGVANRIVLWPLGGIAYVNPPPRPGAWLWSIAAGPLVNVILLPLTLGLYMLCGMAGVALELPDLLHFLWVLVVMNLALLLFNLLPVYPLDGGQILQALLWFIVGRARSLLIVSVLGLLVGLGMIALALSAREFWLGIIAAFIALRSWAGFQQARGLARLARAERHQGFACPSCRAAPLKGAFWWCDQCRQPFDTFDQGAVCPACGKQFAATACLECRNGHPLSDWILKEVPADNVHQDRLTEMGSKG